MKTRSWRPASSGLRGNRVRRAPPGGDDELFSSPAGRDARARVGTMTGSNLAESGKSDWSGISTAGTSTSLLATADGTYHSAKEVLLSVNSSRTEHLTGPAPVRLSGGFAVPPFPRHGDHHRRRHARPRIPPPLGEQREDLGRDHGLRSHRRGELHLPVPREPDGGLGAFTRFETHELIESSDLTAIAERAKGISYQPPGA
jgi:hypothetical protein